ncbi:MAG TPA: RDD family protein [Bacteroidota bacterium]|nr:RDD family protein [Bacteroidota bacterium]
MKSNRTFQLTHIERLNSLQNIPLATFRSRSFAYIIDSMIVGILFVVSVVGVLLVFDKEGKIDVHFDPFHTFWSLVALVIYFTIATYFGNGQTIGKRLFRIRVVSLTHTHLSFWHSFERSLGYGASALEGGFGFLQYFINPNCQTIHDRIAETIVIEIPKKQHS